MSNNVVWNIVKKSSAGLIKREGVVFAGENGNLKARNTSKYSGYMNSSVGMTVDAAGKGVLRVSKAKRANSGKNLQHKIRLSRGSVKRRNGLVKAATAHRPDLQKAALAKFTAIHKASVRKSTGVMKPRPKRVNRRPGKLYL